MHESNVRLFESRSTEDNVELAEKLILPPEKPLSPEEVADFMQFESELYEGRYAELSVEKYVHKGKELDLEQVFLLNSQSLKIYVDYLLTDEGREFATNLGLTDVAAAKSTNEVREALRAISFDALQKLPVASRDKLEGNSAKFAKGAYVAAIIEGQEIDSPEHVQLIVEPENLVGAVDYFMRFVSFLSAVRDDLKADDTALSGAKIEATIIYQKRINSELAEKYTLLLSLYEQLSEQGRAEEFAPTSNSRFTRLTTSLGSFDPVRLSQMLDRIRNGAQETEVGYSALGDSHRQAISIGDLKEPSANIEPIFNEAEQAILNEIKFDAHEMQRICEGYLARLGLLSEYTFDVENDKKRTSAAPDEKWQVFIDDGGSDGMAINPLRKTIRISARFNRTANQVEPAGVVGLLAHEIGAESAGHVFQAENMKLNLRNMKFTKTIKGRGAIVLKEAGGVNAENNVQQVFFGKSKRLNFEYSSAMSVLESGGSELDAIKAFANGKLAKIENPTDAQVESILLTAVDRVMRITRRHGGFNSQPLIYAEQGIIANQLAEVSQELKNEILSEASLSISDMVRLHTYGLIGTGEKFIPAISLEDYIVPILKDKITLARSSS